MQLLWDAAEASGKSEFELLIYSSRLIGKEPSLTLSGGGNTSLKQVEEDFRRRPVQVLRVKGSGADLATIDASGFPAVRMDDVLPLLDREQMDDEAMMQYLRHTLLEPGSRNPSIETLLHAFLPFRAIHHSHADAVLYLADNTRAEELLRAALGDDVVIVPYIIPGFELAQVAHAHISRRPGARGAVLLNHGLFTWGETCEESYRRHIELVTRLEEFVAAHRDRPAFTSLPGLPVLRADERRSLAAAVAPSLRGLLVGSGRHLIVAYDDSEPVMGFVSSAQAPHLSQVGAATPDHMLHTKRLPLYVQPERLEPAAVLAALQDGIARYQAAYGAYVARHNQAGYPPLDATPRVILVAGLGMFTQGPDYRAAALRREIYRHTIDIITGAQAVGEYRSLSEADAFAAEYFPLELAKLRSLPPPRELTGRVALVTGGARGIGLAACQRLAEAGAHVVLTDLDAAAAAVAAAGINQRYGAGRCAALALDVTDPEAVTAAFAAAARTYGGVDVVFSNAGIALTGGIHDLDVDTWRRAFAINTDGHFLVSQAAVRLMRRQGLGGSIVFNVTKNALAPGKEFGAYSCSKAAEAQLCRILAIEHGAEKIRANMIHPDAVLTDLWSPQMRAERARAYGIPVEQLPQHLQARTLLGEPVTAEDVAEAVLYFASDRSAKSTGNMLVVDAGARESFPR